MFDAYKVAVKLSLINHVSTSLVAIAGEMSMLHRSSQNLQAGLTGVEKKLKDIKTLGLIGAGVAGVGFGMLSMLKAPLEEAKKFDQQVGKFKLFGMGDALNNEAIKFAKGMNIMGSSYTENMKLITESQGVFRESGLSGSHALEGAKMAAPFLAKIAFATSSLDGESAAKLKHSSLAMLRYVEMSGGLSSPERFKQIADSGWKMAQTSGGAVDWEQLRQYKARAGVAAQYMTDEGMAMMEPVIAELKGSTAGFASRTAFNRLNGIIKIPNQVAHELVKSGVWDGSKVNWNSQGGIKSFIGNPLKDSELMMQNQVAFYEKNIMPMYQRMGLNSPEARARENAMIFGSTGGTMFTLIDRQLPAIHRSLDAWKKALGVDDSVNVAKGTLAGKEVDLHAKWKNVLNNLGDIVLPMAIKGVENMTIMLSRFSKFAEENPRTIRALTWAFIGLVGSLAFSGTVLLLRAGFSGLSLAAGLLQKSGVLGLVSSNLSVLGKASLVAAAGFAGWELGTWLNKTFIEGTKFSNWLGSFIAKILAFMGSKEAKESLRLNGDKEWSVLGGGKSARGNDYNNGHTAIPGRSGFMSMLMGGQSKVTNVAPPPSAGQPVQVTTQLNVDGRKIAEVVSKHQAKDMARAPVGTNIADGTMNPFPVGFSFGY